MRIDGPDACPLQEANQESSGKHLGHDQELFGLGVQFSHCLGRWDHEPMFVWDSGFKRRLKLGLLGRLTRPSHPAARRGRSPASGGPVERVVTRISGTY